MPGLRLAQALRNLGVVAGDRVCAYMPNIPGTLIAMLAAASIGAVFSSCSPDFGVAGARSLRSDPAESAVRCGRLLLRRQDDRRDRPDCRHRRTARKASSTSSSSPTPAARPRSLAFPRRSTSMSFWAKYAPRNIEFAQLPFDHPLYILSIPPGRLRPEVHRARAGGTLLQHRRSTCCTSI